VQRVDNPPNPYLGEYRQWLGPPPEAKLTVYEEHADSALAKNDSPDIPFCWSVNPYRGCQHACAYCYARRTHEYLGFGAGSDFDTQIVAKVNAPERLAAAFSRRSWKREVVMFSGVTDCYQPLEAVYRLTRRCLEVCVQYANPVRIVTKAYLVVRDIDVLTELHCRADVRICFSMPFADARIARLIETHAPSPDCQFEAMRRLAAAGLPVGIIVAPLIPGLNDRDIPALLARAAACGATTACYTPVRLPGNVAPVFLSRLRQVLPLAAAKVERLVRDLRGGRLNHPEFGVRMRADGAYWESIERLFETMATRYGLNCGQPWQRPECGVSAKRAAQLRLF